MIDRRRALIGQPTGLKNLMTQDMWMQAFTDAWGADNFTYQNNILTFAPYTIWNIGRPKVLFSFEPLENTQYTIILYGKTKDSSIYTNLSISYSETDSEQLLFTTPEYYSYAKSITSPILHLIGLSPTWWSSDTSLDLSKCGVYKGDVRNLFN